MVFAGSAAAGSLVAALVTARARLRGRRRLAIYAAGCLVLLAGGVALSRREALAVIVGFAVVPFAAGFAMARGDLRRQRR